jgi:hypothetical protein
MNNTSFLYLLLLSIFFYYFTSASTPNNMTCTPDEGIDEKAHPRWEGKVYCGSKTKMQLI